MAKKASGAEGRRRRKVAAEAALQAQAKRVEVGDLPAALARYKKLGRPPEIETVNVWGARVIAEALYQAANDPVLDESSRRAQIAALGDRLIKAHARGMLEATVAKIKKQLGHNAQRSTIVEERGCDVPRSPTARGMGRPRILPPEPTEPTK